MSIIGDKIKNARLRRGLSQDKLAKAIGVTKATICRYELGSREPRADQLKSIANALNVTISYLHGYDNINTLDFLEALESNDYQAAAKLANEIEPKLPDDLAEAAQATQQLKNNLIGDLDIPLQELQRLQNIFSALNVDGIKVVIKLIEDIAGNPKYQRKDPPATEEKPTDGQKPLTNDEG